MNLWDVISARRNVRFNIRVATVFWITCNQLSLRHIFKNVKQYGGKAKSKFSIQVHGGN